MASNPAQTTVDFSCHFELLCGDIIAFAYHFPDRVCRAEPIDGALVVGRIPQPEFDGAPHKLWVKLNAPGVVEHTQDLNRAGV